MSSTPFAVFLGIFVLWSPITLVLALFLLVNARHYQLGERSGAFWAFALLPSVTTVAGLFWAAFAACRTRTCPGASPYHVIGPLLAVHISIAALVAWRFRETGKLVVSVLVLQLWVALVAAFASATATYGGGSL